MDKLKRNQIRRLLWRWGKVAEYCANKQREANQFRALVDSALDVHCSPLSDMPKGNSISDTVARKAEKHEYLQNLYKDKIQSLENAIEFELKFSDAMDAAIDKLDAQEQSVLEMRYKRKLQYVKIAYRAKYSEENVKKIERGAVEKLGKYVDIKDA